MIKKFIDNGWIVLRISKGSHYQLGKNGEYETIPYHTRDLKPGIQAYLLKRLKEVD